MSQKLPAPCYQTYAASTLASLPFRQSDLATRGLVHTLEMELWVNRRLPRDPESLAYILYLDAGEVAALLPAAMAFFSIDGNNIFSQRLDDYRAHLDEIREKQRTGGIEGAAITNGKKKRPVKRSVIGFATTSQVDPQVYQQVDARVSSKAKSSTAKQNQNQPSRSEDTLSKENTDWAEEYSVNQHKFPCGVPS